jgi:hypothetical protein
MGIPDQISINYNRRFGVEIEINAFDGRDFKRDPLSRREKPVGLDYIASLVSETVGYSAKATRWHHTHNNFTDWICKPDSSCGLEICSPAATGRAALREIEMVISALASDEKVRLDDRCSLHLHVNVADCISQESRMFSNNMEICPERSTALASILAHWIKCEAVFLDSVPVERKRNSYCQCIGLSDVFEHTGPLSAMDLILRLGDHKYFTVNTYHLVANRRPTIEFRIVEKEGCLNANLAKNWIRLILHFVEMTKDRGVPKKYKRNDPWSSLLWLDPKDVLLLLGFLGNATLDHELEETRNWFLARLVSNIDTDLLGIWSRALRRPAREKLEEAIEELGLTQNQLFSYLDE